MIEMHGNIFDTEQNHIGHGVNLLGLMGGGIAAQFKLRYPQNYLKYRTACMTGQLGVGEILVTKHRDLFIHNIASQNKPGPHARYDWLVSGLQESVKTLLSYEDGSLLAIPEIGAGIGGLKWSTVHLLLLGIEAEHNAGDLFEVWHYRA